MSAEDRGRAPEPEQLINSQLSWLSAINCTAAPFARMRIGEAPHWRIVGEGGNRPLAWGSTEQISAATSLHENQIKITADSVENSPTSIARRFWGSSEHQPRGDRRSWAVLRGRVFDLMPSHGRQASFSTQWASSGRLMSPRESLEIRLPSLAMRSLGSCRRR